MLHSNIYCIAIVDRRSLRSTHTKNAENGAQTKKTAVDVDRDAQRRNRTTTTRNINCNAILFAYDSQQQLYANVSATHSVDSERSNALKTEIDERRAKNIAKRHADDRRQCRKIIKQYNQTKFEYEQSKHMLTIFIVYSKKFLNASRRKTGSITFFLKWKMKINHCLSFVI
jgi:hypothetical protein